MIVAVNVLYMEKKFHCIELSFQRDSSDCVQIVSQTPETASMSVPTSFFIWAFGVSVFVCVMYQCVISDRGSAVSVSVCCALCQHRSLSDSSFCSADRQWWRAALTPDQRVPDTLTHCPALRVHRSDPDGRPETKTHTHRTVCSFRAVSTPLNWANLEWTQAQLKTSQLTESNSLYIFFGCSAVVSEVFEKLMKRRTLLWDTGVFLSRLSRPSLVFVCEKLNSAECYRVQIILGLFIIEYYGI